MSEDARLLQRIPLIYWVLDSIGTVLLGLGMFAYFTPGQIGGYEFKPHAIDMMVLGPVLMIPMVVSVLRLGRKRAAKPDR
jgi:hypothetical protein